MQDFVDAAGIDARLCGWVEEHPTLLLERDAIAAIGALRGRGSPILALDERGAIVIVQRLYSDDAPAAIGEALAEAARIDSMPFAELDDLARRLDGTGGRGLRAIYHDAFLAARPDAERALERIAFNSRQRVVFVATAFTAQCERTLRYLRFACGADAYAVQINVYGPPAELTIETRLVVGFDGLPKVPSPGGASAWPRRPAPQPLDTAAVVEAAVRLLRTTPRDDTNSGDLLAA